MWIHGLAVIVAYAAMILGALNGLLSCVFVAEKPLAPSGAWMGLFALGGGAIVFLH